MCDYPFFIPQVVLFANSSLFWFKVTNEHREFRNYLCNLYSKIGRFGGAGSLVPITGFANSVASSAIEYKAEGQVFGIGCKIFTIAGPVILYGILSSWILGVIYYLFTMIP